MEHKCKSVFLHRDVTVTPRDTELREAGRLLVQELKEKDSRQSQPDYREWKY